MSDVSETNHSHSLESLRIRNAYAKQKKGTTIDDNVPEKLETADYSDEKDFANTDR
jgi:hypothetical protein